MKRVPAAIFGALLVAATQAFAAGQTIAGDVVKVDGASVEVRSASGELVHVRIPDNARISGRAPSDVGKITQGSFVGTTAVAQPDGTLLAREVHIFPESMRGTGEGHYPWDLQPQSTMTNANVEEVVSAVDGRTLTLKYKDGEKKITVPASASIVTYVAGDKSDIKPGAKAFIVAVKQADGTLQGRAWRIGRDGVTPPM